MTSRKLLIGAYTLMFRRPTFTFAADVRPALTASKIDMRTGIAKVLFFILELLTGSRTSLERTDENSPSQSA